MTLHIKRFYLVVASLLLLGCASQQPKKPVTPVVLGLHNPSEEHVWRQNFPAHTSQLLVRVIINDWPKGVHPYRIECVFPNGKRYGQIYDKTDSVFKGNPLEGTVSVDRLPCRFTRLIGFRRAGWPPGRYKVNFYISDRLAASKSFEMESPGVFIRATKLDSGTVECRGRIKEQLSREVYELEKVIDDEEKSVTWKSCELIESTDTIVFEGGEVHFGVVFTLQSNLRRAFLTLRKKSYQRIKETGEVIPNISERTDYIYFPAGDMYSLYETRDNRFTGWKIYEQDEEEQKRKKTETASGEWEISLYNQDKCIFTKTFNVTIKEDEE